jgi:serine/threonine protein kinase
LARFEVRRDLWQAGLVRPPQLLNGRYRMDSHLGSGGMSVVWKAHDQVLDRDVAVKLLAGRYATDPAARERVRAEAQAAARLWHPNVTSGSVRGPADEVRVVFEAGPVQSVVTATCRDGTPVFT